MAGGRGPDPLRRIGKDSTYSHRTGGRALSAALGMAGAVGWYY